MATVRSSRPPAARLNRRTASGVANRFGRVRLERIDHLDLQEFVDELDPTGTNPSTIEGGSPAPTRLPLGPSPRRRRHRPDRRPRAAGEVIPPAHPALAGRRRSPSRHGSGIRPPGLGRGHAGPPPPGELLALDLKTGVLRVERSYDPTSGAFGRPRASTASAPSLSPPRSPHTSASMLSAPADATAWSSEPPRRAHSTRAAPKTAPTPPGPPRACTASRSTPAATCTQA